MSTASLDALQGFLGTIGFDLARIRTPAIGSLVTYAGMSQEESDAAVAAGATLGNRRHVIASVFDNQGTSNSLYEPLA